MLQGRRGLCATAVGSIAFKALQPAQKAIARPGSAENQTSSQANSANAILGPNQLHCMPTQHPARRKSSGMRSRGTQPAAPVREFVF